MRRFPLLVAVLVCLSSSRLVIAGDANRVCYLDEVDPYYVSQNFPKLITPQWVGEEGIELVVILSIEKAMGRQRIQPKGPRLIDIDILLFGATHVNTPQLTIPHPAMAERRFVLEPLAEIAPAVRVPLLKKTVRELLDALPKGGPKVKKIPRS